jgi:hypothetical protein
VRGGVIRVSNGTDSAAIDLSKADGVADVIALINAAGVGGITASLNAAGDGIAAQRRSRGGHRRQ